jgi:iron(II)-dependent oxidoreductase
MALPGLSDQLAASRSETDRLFRLVEEEDYYLRPLPQRHRLIFYLGHLEAFDWNQVARHGLSAPHLNLSFDKLF